jgi:hypothetical protein
MFPPGNEASMVNGMAGAAQVPSPPRKPIAPITATAHRIDGLICIERFSIEVTQLSKREAFTGSGRRRR